MAKVKLANIMSEVLWERCLINQRVIQLEHSLSEDQKLHGFFKEYVVYARNTLNTEQFSLFQRFYVPTITEAGISDDEIADAISSLAKELQVDVGPVSKYLTDPENIDADALKKGDVEQGIKTDDQQSEAYTNIKPLLKEAVASTILAAPAILKLIAEIIEYIKRNYDIESNRILSVYDSMYKFVKGFKPKILSQADLADVMSKPGTLGIKTSRLQAVYKNDEAAMKADISKAYNELARLYSNEHSGKGDATSSDIRSVRRMFDAGKALEPGTKATEELQHILYNLTYSSSASKGIANIAHKLHSAFIIPFRTILTPIFTVLSVPWKEKLKAFFSKDGWKKGWEKASVFADILYTIIMATMVAGDIESMANTSSTLAGAASNAFGSIGNAAAAVKTAIKGGDLSVDAVQKAVASAAKAAGVS